MTGYRYDEDVRERVTRLLFAALPALYRVRDGQGADPEALYRFLRVLGAPAALLRQNIEELHADLFIDTGHDHVIPLLADMVGTTLVFPDAAANRRDVRGTVGFRRRKGSLQMLQEMGEELTAQLVVAQEGWKRIQLAQNLNLLRVERTTPDLRPALVAEQAHGPLDALFHAVDLRAISAQTGRHHPKHVVHWIHPTLTFPLRRVTSVSESVPGSDQRFAMHPLGAWLPLRARPTPEHPLRTDRIPELHFAATPADWFGIDGRFSIEICGLAAAVPGNVPIQRTASVELADQELVRGAVALTLVDHDTRAWQGRMTVEVGTAPFLAVGPGAWIANVAAFIPRAAVELDGSGVVSSSQNPGPSTNRVVLLRVRPPAGIGGRYFPGATFEVAGGQPAAHAAARDAELAREGFVRGGLHVTVPRLQVIAERFLFVAADGSVYDAHETPGAPASAPMPESGGRRVLSRRRLLENGPGPAFPPTPTSAAPTFVTRVPSAPGRGPAVMHGGIPVLRAGSDLTAVPPGTECALSFAVRVEQTASTSYRPFLRLTWTGSDPSTAVWSALDSDGSPVPADPARVSAEYAATAELRERGRGSFPLAVRFECSRADGTLTPAEVAFTTDDGRPLLIHLPELAASAATPEVWPRDAIRFPAASRPVRVAADGSTWSAVSSANERQSAGAIAPLRGAVALRRRRVRWRRLCAWQNEDWTALPPRTLALTQPGYLDVDVAQGLFAMAAEEPVQRWPADALGVRPASVTASFEEGATMHLGARPDAREPVLDQRLLMPTRIVSGSGHLSANAPAAWHTLPRYATLTEALAALSGEWYMCNRGGDTLSTSPDRWQTELCP